ncbi:MAG TPA: tetratricopeptide repeat protein [Candidatus Krumholzibacteria bacterium]|nr:tetratricopeptide repeat protein [Candidatus Krumholzibacteria bacterium]
MSLRASIIALIALVLAASPAAATPADTARVALPDPVLAENLPRGLAARDSARAAAHSDRHAEAIRYYRRAIALYPPLEEELAVELGHQYMWSDQPDSSMLWFRKQLEHDPDHVEARLGVARLTSWNDDHGRAEKLYNDVLADDPDNLDALLGRAQVANWSGRNREATWLYGDILDRHPGNAEAREGLARAYYWGGRPDWAREVVADGERTPALASLERDIERDRAPGVTYTFDHNTDSDDIERRTHTLRLGTGAGDATRVSGEYGHAGYQQPARPDVSRDWLAAVLETRFNEYVGLTAAAGYQWNSFDRAALGPESYWQDEFNLFTFDGFVTFLPHDWTRIDVGLFHGSLQNPDAIFRGISLTELSGGLDLRFNTNTMWITTLEAAWYSDVNNRIGAETRLAWQPFWRLPGFQNRFTSTTGFAGFGFDETRDNGYYDPRQYLSLYQDLALEMRLSSRVRANVAGRIALEKENGGDWFTAGSASASVSWAVWRGLGLTVGGYTSESRLSTREGYQADGFYITVDYRHWK